MPQLSETDGAAQFPGQGTLSARPIDALLVMILCRNRGIWYALKQEKVASGAQQLGRVPTLIGALALRERVIDRQKALRYLPDACQAFRQHAEKRRVAQNEPCLAKFVESGA